MSGTDTENVNFEELLGLSEERVSSVSESDVLERFEELEAQMNEAQDIGDKDERDRRMEILSAEMTQLREKAKLEERDLAQSVLELEVLMNSLGEDYEALERLNPHEQRLIDNAKNTLAGAKTELTKAKNSFFIGRGGRVSKAQDAFANAKAGVPKAEELAAQKMRDRLMNHSMEESLAEFQLRVEKTVAIMKDRYRKIREQEKIVAARLQEALKVKAEMADALDKARDRVDELKTEVFDAEQRLGEFQAGTADYVEQEKVLTDLRGQMEDAKSARSVAMAVYESKEKFATELQVHQEAQKKMATNQITWIKVLESDTAERVVTFKSRLEAMKTGEDQEVARKLDDLGAKVDQQNAEFMAASVVASDRILLEKLGMHPERMRAMAEVREVLTEHLQGADDAMLEMIDHMEEKYGINPLKGYFSNYQQEGVGGEVADA